MVRILAVGEGGSGIGGGAGESLDVKPAYLKRFREAWIWRRFASQTARLF
jgi:hypothetical protein